MKNITSDTAGAAAPTDPDTIRRVATGWVVGEAAPLPGFAGAMLHGSAAWLAPGAALAPGSDVDILIVVRPGATAPTPGKRAAGGLLLDVTVLDAGRVREPGVVLRDYHLAGSFRGTEPLADLDGALARVAAEVGARFADPAAVGARCDHAVANARRHLDAHEAGAPLHDRVTAWLFGTGVTAHVLLTAGLRNPTVRRRYEAVHDLLAEHRRPAEHEWLLRLLGSAHLTRRRVERHLGAIEAAFDRAAAAARTPFFFSSDITPTARPIAIDGVRRSIEQGFHREAMFWLAATACRCRAIVAHDAPAELEPVDTALHDLLADLGIASDRELAARVDATRAALPTVRALAGALIAEHPPAGS